MPDTIVPASESLSQPLVWPAEGPTRVPFRVYHDPEILRLEHERIFRGAGVELSVHGDRNPEQGRLQNHLSSARSR